MMFDVLAEMKNLVGNGTHLDANADLLLPANEVTFLTNRLPTHLLHEIGVHK